MLADRLATVEFTHKPPTVRVLYVGRELLACEPRWYCVALRCGIANEKE